MIVAKFVEIPLAPREIDAVRFDGVVKGIPKIKDETTPDWLLAAFANGTLKMVNDEVCLDDEVVISKGDWLTCDHNGVVCSYSDPSFSINYRRKRKLPVARKPRAVKVAA